MRLLTPAEQISLVDLLMQLQNIELQEVRQSLLFALPKTITTLITESRIPRIHIQSIISASIDQPPPDTAGDNWPIVQVIANAIPLSTDSDLIQNLKKLHDLALARATTAAGDGGVTRPKDVQATRIVPSYPPTGDIDTAVLRELLTAALSSSDLSTVCFDYFPPVYEDFGSGMTKSEKITRLMEYCTRNGQLERLVEILRKANPYQYAQFQGKLRKP